MTRLMFLSIIIPAYNEEARIGTMLDRYISYFNERYRTDFEVIVVVNGSNDNTEAITNNYASRFPFIRVIVEPNAIGKGGAIIKGFKAASGELVGFVDADCSTPPAAFDDLIKNIGDADCIIASRWLPGAIVEPKQPLKRRIASRVFNLIVSIFFNMKLTDTQCGAKIIKKGALLTILPYIGITRWAFDVDLLFQLKRNGFKIIEYPTIWQDTTGSKLRVLNASIEMLLAITRLRLIYSPLKFIVDLYDITLGKFLKLK